MPKLKSESSINAHLFTRLINAIWREPDAIPFHYPVNYKDLGLLDYPILIKSPMDLSTIRKNIKGNKYPNLKSFLEDLSLIWSNCKHYNLEDSVIYGQADRMEKLSKKILANTLKKKSRKKSGNYLHRTNQKELRMKDFDFGMNQKNELLNEGEQEERSFKDKIKICQIIKKLTPEQLVEVIRILQKNDRKAIEVINEEKFHIKLEEFSLLTIKKILNYFEEIKILEKLNNYI